MITVITPTYNRASKLPALYLSLVQQTSDNFEWVIVDDGSTDNTEAVISSFINENKIKIRYLKKENGGKHTALNAGIKTIDSVLTFIVDSDDTLTSDAIQTIEEYSHKYKDRFDLCGFSFLREYPDGTINGRKYIRDELVSNYIDIRVNGNDMNSDKAEVFYTRCLKEFPFPEIRGERFLGEDIIWVKMGRKYKMVYINKPIYIGNYLEDGLTKNRRLNNINSPVGCMLRAEGYLHNDINLKFREKCALQYLIYGWFANRSTKKLIDGTNEKVLVIANYLPAKMIFEKWKKEYKEN